MSKKDQTDPYGFDVSKMTVEELREKLRELGFPLGSWVSNEEYVKEGDQAQIPTFKKYAETLTELRGVLETQVEKDLKDVDELNYQLHRLKHGGGR
jgi:hypothetical protein